MTFTGLPTPAHSRRVEHLLEEPDGHFRQAADYFLKKNAGLSPRLA
jgi:hypothetical protein